jgi:hypothetical protein
MQFDTNITVAIRDDHAGLEEDHWARYRRWRFGARRDRSSIEDRGGSTTRREH